MGFRYAFCVEGDYQTFNPNAQGKPTPAYLEQVARRYRNMGYDAVESVGILMREGGSTADYKTALGNAGVEFSGLHWLLAKIDGVYLTKPDSDIMSRTQEEIIALAKMTAALGGRVMVHGSPLQRNLPAHNVGWKRAFDITVENYRAIMKAIGHLPTWIAFEQLSHQETDFMTTMADVRALVEAVDHPHFRAVLDTKALYSKCGTAQEVADAIREYADIAVHFHANDPESPDGLIGGPGLSQFDFTPIFQALKDVGWHEVHNELGRKRHISVECFDFKDRPLDKTARRSIEYMKAVEAKVFGD